MTQSSFMHLHPVQFNFLIKYEVKECPFTRLSLMNKGFRRKGEE